MRYIIIILFVGISNSYVLAQTSDEYCNSGIEKFKQHNYSAALSEFDKAIELNPNSSRAYNNRGIIKSILNDTTGAVADYDKAIIIEPHNSSAYKNRAQLQMRLKNYSVALADYNKVLQFNSDDEAVLKNIKLLKQLLQTQSKKEGVAEKKKKDTMLVTVQPIVKRMQEKKKTEESAVKAEKIEEGKSAAANIPLENKKIKTHLSATDYVKRGQSRVQSSYYIGAYEDYTKAIELDSLNAQAYYYRGLLKATLRDYKGELKEEDANRNISFERKKEEAFTKRELFKGDFGAIEDYTKAITLNPAFVDAYYDRAMSFYYLQEYRNAIANYTQVIALNKGFAAAYYYRGMAKGILSDMSSACIDFRKAAELGSVEAKDLLNDCK
jgi:tetratricopeptide (TPR) repeat protein